eukprot:1187607-Prorocentrum_minimum.AAC.2
MMTHLARPAVGHPGLTNDFHEKEATPYAVLARSKHVGSSSNAFKANEHCHREITQQLLLGENGLLKLDGDVSVPSASRVESLVQHLILATDPSTQGAFLKRLDDRMTEGLDWNSPDDRVLHRCSTAYFVNVCIPRMNLHGAPLCNPVDPAPTCETRIAMMVAVDCGTLSSIDDRSELTISPVRPNCYALVGGNPDSVVMLRCQTTRA